MRRRSCPHKKTDARRGIGFLIRTHWFPAQGDKPDLIGRHTRAPVTASSAQRLLALKLGTIAARRNAEEIPEAALKVR